MQEKALLRPLQFRFTDPTDVATYGDEPYVYDEHTLVRLPARTLVELEAELGMTMVDAMNGFRRDSVLGNLAGCWLAVRQVDVKLAGNFDDFAPVIMLITYESASVDQGKEQAVTPLSQESPTYPPPDSDQAPMVVLQNSPRAE